MRLPEGDEPGSAAPTASVRWFRRREFWIGLEVALILGLLAVWVTSETVRAVDHLGILFLYSFPSEFLVGLVPHEPVLIHYGTSHPAWVVAVVAGGGTVLAEAVNYSIFGYVYERPSLQAFADRPVVRHIVELFDRRPFLAILVAGFSPVPFFPVRFLVVMTGYPRARYLTGVALARTPRFFILAALGGLFEIPATALGVLMVLLLATVNLPALVRLLWGEARRAGETA